VKLIAAAGRCHRLAACGTSELPRATEGTFVQDLSDRTGTEPALNDAAEAIVDLRGRAQLNVGRADDIADVVIADHITGTDDHVRNVARFDLQ